MCTVVLVGGGAELREVMLLRRMLCGGGVVGGLFDGGVVGSAGEKFVVALWIFIGIGIDEIDANVASLVLGIPS